MRYKAIAMAHAQTMTASGASKPALLLTGSLVSSGIMLHSDLLAASVSAGFTDLQRVISGSATLADCTLKGLGAS
jgi:hypothetical protein